MAVFEIAGMKIQYDTIDTIRGAVEAAMARIDGRLKKLDGERRTLSRQRRALKGTLGGKERKSAAQAPRGPLVPA